ncbi:MAG: hypothetical protein H7145_17660, partial [Akkermansiaceae bacterium]|nr:hypothetical protein [Armatimonadota bacterium]
MKIISPRGTFSRQLALLARTAGICASLIASVLVAIPLAIAQSPSEITVDFKGYRKNAGIAVVAEKPVLRVGWSISERNSGTLVLNLEAGKPLIESLGVSSDGKPARVIARQLDPAALLTIGERDLKNPAGWVAFFDNPPKRPHKTVPIVLEKQSVRVSSEGARTTIHIGKVSADSFHGDLRFTFYRNSPLIHVEYVVTTKEDGRAILYDTGLTSASPTWQSVSWNDTDGRLQRVPIDADQSAHPVKVAGRTIVAESQTGSIAAFP